ncbi:MAG: hypothetical protein EBV06_04990 [Planctomycetia bacterium]|nr:hypothetical protein [Planctomycetia bacterium]
MPTYRERSANWPPAYPEGCSWLCGKPVAHLARKCRAALFDSAGVPRSTRAPQNAQHGATVAQQRRNGFSTTMSQTQTIDHHRDTITQRPLSTKIASALSLLLCLEIRKILLYKPKPKEGKR